MRVDRSNPITIYPLMRMDWVGLSRTYVHAWCSGETLSVEYVRLYRTVVRLATGLTNGLFMVCYGLAIWWWWFWWCCLCRCLSSLFSSVQHQCVQDCNNCSTPAPGLCTMECKVGAWVGKKATTQRGAACLSVGKAAGSRYFFVVLIDRPGAWHAHHSFNSGDPLWQPTLFVRPLLAFVSRSLLVVAR